MYMCVCKYDALSLYHFKQKSVPNLHAHGAWKDPCCYAVRDVVQVDGVLVQLPLPSHLNEERVMEAIDPAKDVDGFHPLNMGWVPAARLKVTVWHPVQMRCNKQSECCII